jgi:hypothetical protein
MKEFEKTKDRYGRKSANFSGHNYTNEGVEGSVYKDRRKKRQNAKF